MRRDAEIVRRSLGIGAVAGGVIYAVAGGVMAARNLGWFGWSQNSDPVMVWLGLGLALIVLAFGVVRGADIWSGGPAGRIAAVAGIAAAITLLASGVIQFAIFGTLLTFVAFVAFTVMVYRRRHLPRSDVTLLVVATVASITWNTETPSAALLVVVGLVAGWISFRALLADRWAVASQPGA